ncbi:MAG: OmpA family protein [Flavobacteriaceae bacterium]
MKTTEHSFKYLALVLVFLMAGTQTTQAQFLKKLGKKAEEAAKRTVERRVEKETQEKTDQALDSILEPKQKKKKTPDMREDSPSQGSNGKTNDAPMGDDAPTNTTSDKDKPIEIYSKFDFVPGDKILFFDDLKNDFVGDFPSKWDTNGGGEVVMINNEKWFKLEGKSFFLPQLNGKFPENYTVEFDLFTNGFDNKSSSYALTSLMFSDNNGFDYGRQHSYYELSFCQYIAAGYMARKGTGDRDFFKTTGRDYRDVVKNKQAKISIAVNKNRVRIWLNESKLMDVPRFLTENMGYFKMYTNNFRTDEKDNLYIRNFKVAETSIDYRSTLLKEGRLSTTAILFNSGSAVLKPQSMGMIRQIYQVLQQDTSMKLKIIGHTDADGGDQANMKLSKDRAEAVKKALVGVYGVDASRLMTDGKGESEPMADNGTPEGKAQNRRVEFIRI